jgi:FixJ family two-component response regulator
MTPEPPCVFVVDDDLVHLTILTAILRTAGYREEAFEQPKALLSRVSAHDRGCVVLDLKMPGLNGLELQQAFLARGALLPLIFVSGHSDVPAAVAAMKQGAVDFLPKPVEPKALLAVVARALQRDEESAAERVARDRARARWAELSPREREVCRLVARGLFDKQIAASLGTTQGTVQSQRASALKKLGVGSIAELIGLKAQAGDEG